MLNQATGNRPQRILTLMAILCMAILTGCGPSMKSTPPTAAEPTGPLTELKEIDFIKPYLDTCASFIDSDTEKVRRAIGAVDGTVNRLDGSPHEKASVLLSTLHSQDVGPRVEIPERGFMTVKHSLIEQVQKLATSPPKTKAEQKAAMELGQKVATVQPLINALNSHLYEFQMAQNETQIHVELCTSYPLTAAISLGNARHNNLIERENDAEDRTAVRRLLEMSHRARIPASSLLTVFASYQAAVAGDLSPSDLDATVQAAKSTLDSNFEVTEQEIDEVLNLSREKLAEARIHEAELKALAERTMRPPPPMPGATAGEKAGKVVGALLGLLGSLATGNVAGIIQNAASLLPEDSALGSAVAAGKAVMSGDYKTAMNAAARLAPPDSPLAKTAHMVNNAKYSGTSI